VEFQFWNKKTKSRKLAVVGITVLLIVGIFIAFQLRKNSAGGQPSTNRQMTTSVDVVAVTRTDLIKRISLTGQTVPEAQIDIAAKYQGKVVAVYADLGQNVSEGQELIVQDTGDADLSVLQNRAAYQQAAADAITSESTFKANYDKAQADYQHALNDYNRYQSLYSAGAISRQELDVSQQSLADARASLDLLVNQMNASDVPASIVSARAAAVKAQHNISAAEKQRSDLVLRAPRSGMIGYRLVEAGSMVQAGQKLLSIVDNSHIYVDCQVSEQDLSALAVGTGVSVQIDSLGKTFPGKIIYISPANDAQTLAFSLRIAFDNPDPAIRGGMFTRTVINSVLRPNTFAIAKEAVLNKNGQYYVYVVDAQNTVEERNVQIGAQGDQAIEILNGLNEGEQVAVTNLSRLRAGLVVNPTTVSPDSRGDNK
jgi:HlyD family secretion protein